MAMLPSISCHPAKYAWPSYIKYQEKQYEREHGIVYQNK